MPFVLEMSDGKGGWIPLEMLKTRKQVGEELRTIIRWSPHWMTRRYRVVTVNRFGPVAVSNIVRLYLN